MVHQVYIGVRKCRRKRDYVVVHQSTEWNEGALHYTICMSREQLRGYLQGVGVATLGNLSVVNGIPEKTVRKVKVLKSDRMNAADLEVLLQSPDLA